ncbi:MAG TPA: hypothetical protein VF041_23200 [Gemmatimonadaceae bacterium]
MREQLDTLLDPAPGLPRRLVARLMARVAELLNLGTVVRCCCCGGAVDRAEAGACDGCHATICRTCGTYDRVYEVVCCDRCSGAEG